jgi:hypothetical protein
MMEGPGADSEEKHEPVSDIDTAVVVVGLKALDPEWPIREAIGGIADMTGNATGSTRSRMTQSDRPMKSIYTPVYCHSVSN